MKGWGSKPASLQEHFPARCSPCATLALSASPEGLGHSVQGHGIKGFGAWPVTCGRAHQGSQPLFFAALKRALIQHGVVNVNKPPIGMAF